MTWPLRLVTASCLLAFLGVGMSLLHFLWPVFHPLGLEPRQRRRSGRLRPRGARADPEQARDLQRLLSRPYGRASSRARRSWLSRAMPSRRTSSRA